VATLVFLLVVLEDVPRAGGGGGGGGGRGGGGGGGGGGVGTTTVAAAIGGTDRGVFVGRAVDVLVCRATGDSLIRAGHAARLRLLEPNAAAVVVLPYVRRWREVAAPLDEARALLAVPRTDLSRSLRRYATAVDVVTALTGRPPTSPRPIRERAQTTASTLRRIR